ncbi:putative colanic acid biosynthesis acetyltransferase WcaF [Flavisolibacter ginsengisoli DSM 18119]|uniref:Putative colanic acid biosynthesis acetyltransferase WcaF n=2 Tax=Flavisolibacter TaxID=398041 RepID=A0A1M5E250_9BACT|nr:putative colanic acid biosynthesis acetyltransferase WcaF [Flavisolibacter ginsengisoli DSM 18119]
MISFHDSNSPDAYMRPVFPIIDKLRRYSWSLVWLILCRWTPNPMHSWRICILKIFGAKIGGHNFIYPSCKIWAPWLLETEAVVTIGPGVEIYNPGGIKLAHHTIISQDAYLCGATHDYNSIDFTYLKKPIILEAYSWICAKAIVLPGVLCKEGSVLGAGAVASKDLDPWTVYTGNPAFPVKQRKNILQDIKSTASIKI